MKSNSASIRDCMEKMLELLILVDKTCKEHNVEYWLDGGTLLGAIRHEGYIPWDDDVDICFLAQDFEFIVAKLQAHCATHDAYLSFNDNRPRTYWTDNLADISILKDGVLPVKIDLIPVKSLENDEEQIRIDKSIANIARFFKDGKFKKKEDVLDVHRHYLPLKKSEVLEKKKAFYQFFIDEYLPAHSEKKKGNVYNYAFNDAMVKKERPYYQHDEIFPLKEINFEGHALPCPNNVDSYLKILYGENYLTPPAEKDRIPYAYNNFRNALPKKIIEHRVRLHFDREDKLVMARSSGLAGRLFYKILTFCSLAWKSILKGDFSYVFIYLKFSLRHFLN